MIRVGCIGSAGRKDDSPKMDAELYHRMYGTLCYDLYMIGTRHSSEEITIVSGGAAYADHLAVRAYLEGMVNHLELHLPAEFNKRFIGESKSAGSVANYYHDEFESRTGIDSLAELERALSDKKVFQTVSNGFKERNLLVGNVNYLIAFTFGTDNWNGASISASEAGLKDGGTAHTWDNSPAPHKVHHNLGDV